MTESEFQRFLDAFDRDQAGRTAGPFGCMVGGLAGLVAAFLGASLWVVAPTTLGVSLVVSVVVGELLVRSVNR
jgi:hypothetical protein